MHHEWAQKRPTIHMCPIDGAVHDVGADATAWSYLDSGWASVMVGVDPDPANAQIARTGRSGAGRPHTSTRRVAPRENCTMDEGQGRVQARYQGNCDRLTKIKDTYDPDNLSKVNQNIKLA